MLSNKLCKPSSAPGRPTMSQTLGPIGRSHITTRLARAFEDLMLSYSTCSMSFNERYRLLFEECRPELRLVYEASMSATRDAEA